MELPDEMTYGEAYGPAMGITQQEKAAEYLEALILRHMRLLGCGREEATRIEKTNLGYWAGYYDKETAQRVYQLFSCQHPIFGTSWPSPKEAFKKATP